MMHSVGVIGCGNIFKLAHGPALNALPNVQVKVACDLIEERAKEGAAFLGAERWTCRDEEVFKDGDIDAIMVLTPSHTHAKIAIQALGMGKHVIVEKPMAISHLEGKAMLEAAWRANRELFVGHTRRFDPRWTQIFSEVQSESIGELIAFRRTECAFGAFNEGDWHWMPENRGVLYDTGVHAIDMALWFFQETPLHTHALLRRFRKEARQSVELGAILAAFSHGRQALIEFSWAHPKAYAPFYSTLELVGTKGRIHYSDQDAQLALKVGDRVDIQRFSPMLSTHPKVFIPELGAFFRRLEGGPVPPVTAEDALASVSILDGAMTQASMEEGAL